MHLKRKNCFLFIFLIIYYLLFFHLFYLQSFRSFFFNVNSERKNYKFFRQNERILKLSRTKYDLMYYLWESLNDQNFSVNDIRFLLDQFFPFHEMNQKIFFFDPNKHVERAQDDYVYGTEEIQKIIRFHQFPKNCNDREFIVLDNFQQSKSGIGSLIFYIASFIGLGIDSNKTVIYYPNSFSALSKGGNCTKSGLDCFLIPISSCMFSKEEIDSNRVRFQKHSITDYSRLWSYPMSILPILQKTATPKPLYFFYWRMQASFFLLHFNDNTLKWFNIYKKNFLVNPKSFYDVEIFVRHGDKFTEMKLIDVKKYVFPLKIISKLLNRKISVYVSSDSQIALDFLINLSDRKYEISYLKFQRSQNGFSFKSSNNGFYNTLLSFADLWESKNSNYHIGTLSSNWNKLIIQLRLQYFPPMNLPYFEVGDIKCITPVQCRLYDIPINFKW